MKNFKIISAAILVVSCLNTNISIASTSSNMMARLQGKMKKKMQEKMSGGSGSSDGSGSNDLMAKIKKKMQSQNKGGQSPSQGLGSADMKKLKEKMESMSGGSGSNDLMAKIKKKMQSQNKEGGVKVQSIDPQELVAPGSESAPSAFAAATEETINLSEEIPTVEVVEEPSLEMETTPVPTNFALKPVLNPAIAEETVALPVQNLSEGELMLESSKDLTAPEEEITPTLTPTMEVSDSLVSQEQKELVAPDSTEESESEIDTQPEETSVNQFLAEDELENQASDQSSEDLSAVTSANQFLVEDEDGELEDQTDDLDTEELILESIDTDADDAEEAPSAPVAMIEPVEIPSKEVDAGIEDEITNDISQDQPEEIVTPVVPTEPIEVPIVVMDSEDESTVLDLTTGTIGDDQVIVVKVYPVLDAIYSAAQSIKAAALDMISYVFNKAKAAREKIKADKAVLEASKNNSESAG